MNARNEQPGIPARAVQSLRAGYYIEAVKIVREEYGLGLKEAKERVDRYSEQDPAMQMLAERRRKQEARGCIAWMLALGFAIGSIVLFLLRR